MFCFRLKTFIHESPEPHRTQLQKLLYPFFVNIYLELLQNAQTAAGRVVEWSGVEWSGVEWSGVEWNGMEWNGLEWNGMEWNGMEWNGME